MTTGKSSGGNQLNFKHKLCLIAFIASFLLTIIIGESRILANQSGETSSVFDLSVMPDSKEFYTELNGEWNSFGKMLLIPNDLKLQKKVLPINSGYVRLKSVGL